MSSPCHSPHMPSSPRGSTFVDHSFTAADHTERIEQDPHRFLFKPHDWQLQRPSVQVQNGYSHGRKDSYFVKSGASPDEIAQRLVNHQAEYCLSCRRLKRYNYGLVVISLVLAGLFLNNLFRTGSRISVPFAKHHLSEIITRSEIPSEAHSQELDTRAASPASNGPANIIIPAYFHPASHAQAWQDLYNMIAAGQTSSPQIPYTVIVNPSNGPAQSDGDKASYGPVLKKLATYSNAKILGYVHQTWGSRSVSADVQTWINQYADKLDGIFFDEMPENVGTGNLNLTFVQNTHADTKKRWPSTARSSTPLLVQNPGTEVDSRYYTIQNPADVTIIFENKETYLSAWAADTSRASSNVDRSKLSMLVLSSADVKATSSKILRYSKYIFATTRFNTAYNTVDASELQIEASVAKSFIAGGSASSPSSSSASSASSSPSATPDSSSNKKGKKQKTNPKNSNGSNGRNGKSVRKRSVEELFPEMTTELVDELPK